MKLKLNFGDIDFQDLALRHCEKAVITVVGILVVLCAMSGMKTAGTSADISPTDLDSLADAARQNVERSEFSDDTKKSEGLVVSGESFLKRTEELRLPVQRKEFAWSQPWFKYIDFGTVLRQQPKLLAPEELVAAADRGPVWLHQVDAKGNVVYEEFKAAAKKDEEKDKEKKVKGKPKPKDTAKSPMQRRRQMAGGGEGAGMAGGMDSGDMGGMSGMAGAMMGGMQRMGRGGGGMAGGMGMAGGVGMGGQDAASGFASGGGGAGVGGELALGGGNEEDEGGTTQVQRGGRKKRPALSSRGRLAGQDADSDTASATGSAAGKSAGKPAVRKIPKEIVEGLRWVAVTGVYPHAQQRKEYRESLHVAEQPDYLQLMVERRELQSDKRFAEWAPVKMSEIERIMKRSANWDVESPDLQPHLLDGLVQKLPEMATAREWQQVDHRTALKAAVEAKRGGAGGDIAADSGGGGGREGAGMADDESEIAAGAGVFGGARGGMPPMPGAGPMGRGGGGAGMDMMRNTGAPFAGGSGLAGAGASAGLGQGAGGDAAGGENRQQATAKKGKYSNAEKVMVRFIDFTVEPGKTYQYRLKVVVANPNYNHQDVAEENLALEETLAGEWSEPTPPVYVPIDVDYFVLERRAAEREEAQIQVHRWEKKLGEWQVSQFMTKVGDLIGYAKEHKMLDFEENVLTEKVDFTTREMLLDVIGGKRSLSFDGQVIGEDLPTHIFVMNEFGDLISHAEDLDKNNPDRKEREEVAGELAQIVSSKAKQKKGEKGAPETGEGNFGDEERLPSRRGREGS